MIKLTTKLKENVQKYASNSKAMLMDYSWERNFGYQPGNSPNGWNAIRRTPRKTPQNAHRSHKTHQHFSVLINPLDDN